ncbi:MarR family winged helix-turn-helix transcriptional regulator [Edaphobacter sp. 12200R-103]|uniref:MarR family winged helix-turn-helix transcriptional regulator n=1 Tax=Edaphobacter sp. 12200R-103 TaxID=2703788 RepID=UPI00138B2109|nr:MarR family winged helix-turn-helix transcriptional regulator [Edaphobacter sp. 12200R-103]QHS51499.1 winged helix-turn-helix transcriptional regulator [Edaphobacter sp. 12200R-103]
MSKRADISKLTAASETERYLQGKQNLRTMKRIMIQFRVHLDEQLRPQGLTTAQMQVLFAVRNSPGSSGAQIARSCYITPQTTQALLKHLERSGFIVRGKDAVNDRIVTARITPEGERLAESVEKNSRGLQQKLWEGISDGEMKSLSALLERCLQNLDGFDDSAAGY